MTSDKETMSDPTPDTDRIDTTDAGPGTTSAGGGGAADAGGGKPAKEAPRGPLSIRRGSRIRLGRREGRIDTLRGGGPRPYDVLIRWDDEKYPQWLIYTQLEREHELGNLAVL
jgi:hypothetical protein